MESPPVELEECPFRKQLIGELEEAHRWLAELNDQDVKRMIQGDLAGSASLVGQLTAARERRGRALEAIREHIALHGC